MRPELTPEQATIYTRENVLGYTGQAGAERSDPWAPKHLRVSDFTPDYIVGSSDEFKTIQSAINHALLSKSNRRVIVGVRPGLHKGLVYVPKTRFPISLFGLGATPSETILAEEIDAEMPGPEYFRRFEKSFDGTPPPVLELFREISQKDIITTANASVLRVASDDFQLLNLTVQNTYNADRDQPEAQERNSSGQYVHGQHQAVALLVAGADRVQIQDVHLRSFQDTLYLRSPMKGVTVRTCLTGCDIEGDVDFIFGQSTAWFEECTIRSLGSRSEQSWATAPSTDIRTRFGFVFTNCDFTHDGSARALEGRFFLGRQWFEGVRATPYGQSPIENYKCELGSISEYYAPVGQISEATLNSVGKCVILKSRIGAHLRREVAWDAWNGGSWNPRYRPAQYRVSDMKTALSEWFDEQKICFDDIDATEVLLGEYQNIYS